MRVLRNSFKAKDRTLKGWKTRRKNQVWKRPSGEKVALKGFTAEEIHMIKPALQNTDRLLKDDIRLNVRAISKKEFKSNNHYGNYRTGSILDHKSDITVNSRVFTHGSSKGRKVYRVQPSGVVAHEIGHAISPGARRDISRNEYKEFRKSFDYRKPRGGRDVIVEKYKAKRNSPLKGKTTRQSKNAMEDFAETYRGYTGQEMIKHKHWDVVTNKKRDEYFKKYYLR